EALRRPAAQNDPTQSSPPSLGGKGVGGLGRSDDPTPQPPPPAGEGEKSLASPSPQEEELNAARGLGQSEDSDPLTLVAECLERGDRASAANHLEDYVRLHPDQLMFRAQLAELLLRLGRDRAAKAHYEQFITDAQAATGAPRKQLVNAHTRLMEI